jgi:hypothetical protein
MVPVAIDMRLRPPMAQWVGSTAFKTAMWYPNYASGFLGARSAWAGSMDELLSEMTSAGVRYGVIMGRNASGELGCFDNRTLIEALESWPDRFLGFLGIDLENISDSLREARELASHPGVRGFSIEPGSSRTPRHSDDPALNPIFDAAAELGLSVSISLSGLLCILAGHDLSWSSPTSIARLARRYPTLDIIVSHAAWPYAAEMVAVALGSPRVYVSPDVYISDVDMPCAQIYVDAANLFLSDRTLWGTEYPSRGHAEALAAVHKFNWKPGVLQKVLFDNAARLLRLDEGRDKN